MYGVFWDTIELGVNLCDGNDLSTTDKKPCL